MAINFITPLQIILEHREFRQRHSKVIEDDVITQMSVAEIQQKPKFLPRVGRTAEFLQRQTW